MVLTDSQRRNACDALKELSHHRDMVDASPGSAALDELQTLLAGYGLIIAPLPKEEPARPEPAKVIHQDRTPQVQFADALNYAGSLNALWMVSYMSKLIVLAETRGILSEVENATGFWIRKTAPAPAVEAAPLIPADRLTPAERNLVNGFRASSIEFRNQPDRYTYKVGNVLTLLKIIDRLTPAPQPTA